MICERYSAGFPVAAVTILGRCAFALKEAALAKVKPFNGQKGGRYKPGDRLLAFLDGL